MCKFPVCLVGGEICSAGSRRGLVDLWPLVSKWYQHASPRKSHTVSYITWALSHCWQHSVESAGVCIRRCSWKLFALLSDSGIGRLRRRVQGEQCGHPHQILSGLRECAQICHGSEQVFVLCFQTTAPFQTRTSVCPDRCGSFLVYQGLGPEIGTIWNQALCLCLCSNFEPTATWFAPESRCSFSKCSWRSCWRFLEDLEEGVYIQQTLESVLLNEDGKQLMVRQSFCCSNKIVLGHILWHARGTV